MASKILEAAEQMRQSRAKTMEKMEAQGKSNNDVPLDSSVAQKFRTLFEKAKERRAWPLARIY